MSEKRKVEVMSDDIEPQWIEIKFEELTQGDKFRLFEPDGKRVVGEDGADIFTCLSDAFPGPHGPGKAIVWTVNVKCDY